MIIVDSQQSSTSITLPLTGTVVVGVELPTDIDLEMLRDELENFYGDRYSLVSELPSTSNGASVPDVKPPTSAPARKKRAK